MTFKPGDKVTRNCRPEWGTGIIQADHGQHGFKVQFLNAGFSDPLAYVWANADELELAFTTTPSKIAGAHQDEIRDITAQARAAARIDRT